MLRLCCCAALPVLLVAADPDTVRFNDLRLEVGPAPGVTEVSANRPGLADGNGSAVTWERSGRWSLLWAPPVGTASSEGAGMVLVELTSSRQVSQETNVSERLASRSVLGLVHLGIGVRCLDPLTVELTGYGGGGTAWQESGHGRGGAWEAGLRLGATWTFASHAQLGLAARLLVGEARPPARLNGQDYDLVLRSQGVIPAVAVGWRF